MLQLLRRLTNRGEIWEQMYVQVPEDLTDAISVRSLAFRPTQYGWRYAGQISHLKGSWLIFHRPAGRRYPKEN
jgi:hypothetical protein